MCISCRVRRDMLEQVSKITFDLLLYAYRMLLIVERREGTKQQKLSQNGRKSGREGRPTGRSKKLMLASR